VLNKINKKNPQRDNDKKVKRKTKHKNKSYLQNLPQKITNKDDNIKQQLTIDVTIAI